MKNIPSAIDSCCVSYCKFLKNRSNYRELPQSDIEIAIDFSTNDYLNLSKHPEILQAAYDAGRTYGCGSTGSRLLSGNLDIFEKFEAQIAKDKHTQTSIIFSSGYQANIATLSALCDKKIFNEKDVVLFFDKLNHASLYKAVEMSGAKLERYRHKDISMLNDLLKKYENKKCVKFIVSETVFGMDGDVADVAELASLSKKHNALLYLDEAHATGVFGQKGYGLSTSYDLKNIECVIMGTFSKAIGCSGAYVACSRNIKNYLVQNCSGLIYSTAPSPMVIGAAQKSWELVKNMDEDRKRLVNLADYCRKKLQECNSKDYSANIFFDTMNSSTNIIPIRVKSSADALQYKKYLLQHGILVSAVRTPSVQEPRIRLALSTAHSEECVDKCIRVLRCFD